MIQRGATYSEARDGKRLQWQLNAVRAAMLDGEWHTLSELSSRLLYPEASTSARLRDLRKEGYTVEREYVQHGLWRYRLVGVAPVQLQLAIQEVYNS